MPRSGRSSTLVAAALVAASPAAADEATATDGGALNRFALGLSFSDDRFHAIDYGIDGGFRIAGPLWFHGTLRAGHAGDPMHEGGLHVEARVGIEALVCREAGRYCGLVGADGGWGHWVWSGDPETTSEGGGLAVGRLGVEQTADVLGVALRTRAVVETRVYRETTDPESPISPGFGFNLATGWSF